MTNVEFSTGTFKLMGQVPVHALTFSSAVAWLFLSETYFPEAVQGKKQNVRGGRQKNERTCIEAHPSLISFVY